MKVIINNKNYYFEENMSILQACEKINLDIPKFCYHDKLSVAGNCRMCLVELEKAPKPIASCAMPLANNMKIFTDSPLVKKAREATLELLLINHPLDCPICDQGGECDLQDQTLNFGSDRSRFFEYKRGVEDKDCGPIIKTIMTRCIHCTKCVRFGEEIMGYEVLGTLGRGTHTEIGTYLTKFIKSELSGNLVDLCPVGALTSKPYAFIARRWELNKIESIDFFDALGSAVNIYTRNLTQIKNKKKIKKIEAKDEILRILPRFNDSINEYWINDKTRYAFDSSRLNRLEKPYIKSNFKRQELNWKEFFKNLSSDKSKILNKNEKKLGIIGSSLDIESIFYFYNFLKIIGVNDIRTSFFLNQNIDHPKYFRFNNSFTDIEKADLVLIVGSNIRFEASMLNFKLRKAQLKNDLTIAYIGSFYENQNLNVLHLGNTLKTFIDIIEGRHLFCKTFKKAKNPIIILGNDFLADSKYKFNIEIIKFLEKKLYLSKNINILSSDLSVITFNELGLKTLNTSSLYQKRESWSQLYSLQSEIFDFCLQNEKIKDENLIFNFSTHKVMDKFANAKTYAFPITTLYEKNNFILNTQGLIQKSSKSLTPLNETRNLKDIIILFNQLYFNSKLNLFSYKNLIEEFPRILQAHQSKIIKKTPSFKIFIENKFNRKIKLNLENLTVKIKNFYMTDMLSANSKLMSNCSLFINFNRNFKKNTI